MSSSISIRAGDHRKRVQYQRVTLERDGLGQEQERWHTQGLYWMGIRSPNGREVFQAQQIKALTSHVVEWRYPGFLPTAQDRLVYGKRIFNISAVVDADERRRKLIIFASEVNTQVTP
jgi:SPP1 family predicted phage head-tail adaptor